MVAWLFPRRRIAHRIVYLKIRAQVSKQDDGLSVDTVDGPFRPEQQLAGYWGQRPLLVSGAFDAEQMMRSQQWPSWDDIMELACFDKDDNANGEACPGESARLIQHIPCKLDSFTLELGPFDSEYIQEVMTDQKYKWTLLVNDVDGYIPAVSHWMDRDFSFLPRWRRDDAQISIANEGGGIGPHVDNYDVFLIQTAGTRTWSVGRHKMSTRDEMDSLTPDLPVRILRDEFDSEKLTLKAGDMLYLPPRVVHCGTALSDNAMTLSVGCRAPSAAELVARVAESLQETAFERYTDVDLPHRKNTSLERGPSITKKAKEDMKLLVLDTVSELLDDELAWDSLVGKVATEAQRYSDAIVCPYVMIDDEHFIKKWGSSPQEAMRRVMDGNGHIERTTGISFATSTVTPGNSSKVLSRLHAHGETWQVVDDTKASTLFRRIERGRWLDADCLSGIGTELRIALESMIEGGFIVPEEEQVK